MQTFPRTIFTDEHHLYRDTVRRWVEAEVVPHHDAWEEAGMVPRELWRSAGRHGLLCPAVPEEHGGPGVDDYRFNCIVNEELVRAAASGPGFVVHTDICLPYLLRLATEEQRRRWLPGMVSGDLVCAIAMTEPGTGSDLSGIATRAVRDGDHYVVDGSKTFISNGQLADLVITVVRTGDHPHQGLSLLMVEADTPGFSRGRNLDKLGMRAQDTSELHFASCRVPVANLLGEEGAGFGYLVENLPQERLAIAVTAVAAAETVLEHTLTYVKERTAFGRPIGSFQHSRFTLAELQTEVEIARVFVDRCISEHVAGGLSIEHAAMAKWWTTELQLKVVDRCLQLHGGYGYMREYPIARAYADSRVQTIYGGTTEIMKEIIGRSMGL